MTTRLDRLQPVYDTSMSGTENEELYRGTLSKCGGKVKTWNKRAMSLKNDYCLYYYKDVSKRHQGLISLRDPKFAVRKGEKADCSWPKGVDLGNTLVVVTTPRIYYMFADTAEEAQEWREQLAMAHVRMIEGLGGQRKLKAHTSPSVRTSEPHDDGEKKPVPQRFQKKGLKNKVTQRHQTSEESSDHDGEDNIELEEEEDSVEDRSSSVSNHGSAGDSKPDSRSASHSGPPRHYKKKDRHMPTPRFQQEEEEEEGTGVMDMSLDDRKGPLTSTLEQSGATYEDIKIVGTTENYEELELTTEQPFKVSSCPAPTTHLIYDEIPGGKDVLYEDVELKPNPSSKSSSIRRDAPTPKQVTKTSHLPAEESLYNKNSTVVPPAAADSLYDLIAYNAEQESPPPRPLLPAGAPRPSEEVLYDVIQAGILGDLSPVAPDTPPPVEPLPGVPRYPDGNSAVAITGVGYLQVCVHVCGVVLCVFFAHFWELSLICCLYTRTHTHKQNTCIHTHNTCIHTHNTCIHTHNTQTQLPHPYLRGTLQCQYRLLLHHYLPESL